MSTIITTAFLTEATVAVAAAGLSFTAQSVKPSAFVHTGGGVITWTDTEGHTHSLTAAAGVPYPVPYPIASVTNCTGSGSLQFFAGAAAGEPLPSPASNTILASDTQTGIALLSLAAADASLPIVVGDNDPRVAELGQTTDPTVATEADATHYGTSKLSVAPASAHKPIAVGTNDPRVLQVEIPINLTAADGSFAESTVWIPGVIGTITGATLSVNGSVTQSDTDYLTYTLGIHDGAGGGASTVASKSTKTTGGGAFLAFVALTLGAITNATTASISQVTFKAVKSGNGQASTGPALLRIAYTVP